MTDAHREALERILQTFLGMGAVGLAGRAGLAALSPSSYGPAAPKPPETVVVPLRGRAVADDEEDDRPPLPALPAGKAARQKRANPLTSDVDLSLPGWVPGAAWLNRHLPDHSGFVNPDAQTASVRTIPYLFPALLGAGALGGYGGLRLGGALNDRYQKYKSKRELEAARQAYNDELLKGFSKGAADPLGRLDRAAAALVARDKRATHSLLERVLWPLNNLGPEGAAGTLTIAGLAAALAGYGGYEYARDHGLGAARKAQTERLEREDEAERPPLVLGELRTPPALPHAPVSLERRLPAPAA